MRTTRIEIEGRPGHYATVSRKQGARNIDITMLTPDEPDGVTIHADARDAGSIRYAAAWVQKRLDGHQGTAGDIEDYVRVVQTFAD